MNVKERFQVIKTTCFKYKIMRLRGKISYHAFCKNQTIPELIMNQVLKSYNDLSMLNEIKVPLDEKVVCDQEIFNQIKEKSLSHILRHLFKINNEIILIKEFIK